MKDLQTSSSGKFCSTQLTLERGLTEIFEMLSLHTSNIFFANLIEELDTHKANVRRRQWHPTPVLLPGKSMDGGAWWAAVHGVSGSQTRLKRLSSSSSSIYSYYNDFLINESLCPGNSFILVIYILSLV